MIAGLERPDRTDALRGASLGAQRRVDRGDGFFPVELRRFQLRVSFREPVRPQIVRQPDRHEPALYVIAIRAASQTRIARRAISTERSGKWKMPSMR